MSCICSALNMCRMLITFDHKNPTVRWGLIKVALAEQGSSLAAIARLLGIDRSAVARAKVQSYPSVQAAIGQVLGIPPRHIWPERYDASGEPVRIRRNSPITKPHTRGPRRKSAQVEEATQ